MLCTYLGRLDWKVQLLRLPACPANKLVWGETLEANEMDSLSPQYVVLALPD